MTSELEIDTPAELLDVAESLVRGYSGTATPTASELRRSISTAYYAAFSALVARASDVMLPEGSAEESATLSRVRPARCSERRAGGGTVPERTLDRGGDSVSRPD
jgi:hypothetical protein